MRALCERKNPTQTIECRVLKNQPIAKNQWQIWLKPEKLEFQNFEWGNFCMLSLPDLIDPLLPRPFAIVEAAQGTYSFIYRVHGKQTQRLANLPQGYRVDVLGPLGRGISTEQLELGSAVFVAGGVGYASLMPLIQSLSEAALGRAKLFYGIRTDLEAIRRGKLEPQFASDDGSLGYRGRLHELIRKEKFSADSNFYICGPTPMMKACYDFLPPERSYYFLEETMGCGFGICVGCVVSVNDIGPDGKTKPEVHRVKSCLEGPMFLGSQLAHWRAEK